MASAGPVSAGRFVHSSGGAGDRRMPGSQGRESYDSLPFVAVGFLLSGLKTPISLMEMFTCIHN